MTQMRLRYLALLLGAGALTALAEPPYSPYVTESTSQLYWGDTHLHTNLSADAFGFGARLGPDTAYQFARGETVRSNTNQLVKLSRPLDFLVVSDHAEFTGVGATLQTDPERLSASPVAQRWKHLLDTGQRREVLMDQYAVSLGQLTLEHDATFIDDMWRQISELADSYNEPGQFTALIGYEWTALPNGNNLHRNVIFRDDAARVSQVRPFSSIDSPDPEDLWRFLAAYEAQTNGRVMAIPHNANISNGVMFAPTNSAGEPIDQEYARIRARWEPLVEVTQIKGDGETHPFLSPDDPFADYETWDDGNFGNPRDDKTPSMLPYEYARSALQQGLKHEGKLGINPFQFGMIGSSDSHTAFSAVEENNFFGKFGMDEPSEERLQHPIRSINNYAASGYVAVWAADNTRAALFDAMARREVYATTGPRISLRFFGGWRFTDADLTRPNVVQRGYSEGVPMGGTLESRSHSPAEQNGIPASSESDEAPQFLILAERDPIGANLDQIQIVKGWLDADGDTHEQVYSVSFSGQREIDPRTHIVAPISSTVDLAQARYSNAIGSPQLAALWRDPDFDSSEPAVYYVRVLEILTPRWTSYDAAFYQKALPDDVPAIHQERAYSSPIWYRPD
jgi:hypothetical protein